MKGAITWRLAGMFAGVALATFALVGGALYLVLQRELVQHEDDQLATYVQALQYSTARAGTPERWARVVAKMDTLTPADGSVRFRVESPDPRFGYGRDAIALPPYRTLARAVEPLDQRPAVNVIVGINTLVYESTLRTFVLAYTVLALAATLLVGVLGFWIAHLGLRPLRHLSLEARALQPNAPAQRLPTEPLPLELRDLAAAFNGALDRLEQAYQQLEGFNADVAHELRTPLANLIGATQVALARPRAAPELQEVLQSNLEELERLRSIVNDMLFLARADQGEAATALAECAVADEVRKTVDFFEFLLDENDIAVAVEGDLQCRASMERALFRRALSNLVQNAIAHSARGARLVVRIRPEDDFVWVTVTNRGATIAQVHLRRLFDRFYRADQARHDSEGTHGFGLGLAIVKAIASMHGGGVMARSEAGLTTIGFSLQRA
jgi:two-component system heavy metal sensor histidine kinase CusS